MSFDFHGSFTREEWLMEWFGYHGGRELGDPLQKFTDNPKDILEFIDKCKEQNKPAYMSVAPRQKHNVVYGIDRLFFDFDDKDLSKQQEITGDVKRFIRALTEKKLEPFIVKTYHGYHIYLFFKEGVIQVSGKEAKTLYTELQYLLINNEEYKTLDAHVIGDVKRISRIPISYHEKGEYCVVLDKNLKPSKIRSLGFYRNYGIDVETKQRALKICNIKKERCSNVNHELRRFVPNGRFRIRECFEKALSSGEMGHQQRLALVIEAYWARKTVGEIHDLFKNMHDYDEDITDYQVEWQIRKIKGQKLKPYRCSTMKTLNWCIGKSCKYY